jgi:hypothetical protein
MTLDAALAVEALGWAATAIFVASYLFRRPGTLVRVQMAGAVAWIVYGALVGAKPVVAANALVLLAAASQAWRSQRRPAAAASTLDHGAPAGAPLDQEVTS